MMTKKRIIKRIPVIRIIVIVTILSTLPMGTCALINQYETTFSYYEPKWYDNSTIYFVERETYANKDYTKMEPSIDYYTVYKYNLDSGALTEVYNTRSSNVAFTDYYLNLILINDSVCFECFDTLYLILSPDSVEQMSLSERIHWERFLKISDDNLSAYYTEDNYLYEIGMDGNNDHVVCILPDGYYIENVFETSLGRVVIGEYIIRQYAFLVGQGLALLGADTRDSAIVYNDASESVEEVNFDNASYYNWYWSDSTEILECYAMDRNSDNYGIVSIILNTHERKPAGFSNNLSGLRSPGGNRFIYEPERGTFYVLDSLNNILYGRTKEIL